MTLGRKLVRLGLSHEGSAEAFRTEALQMAPISTTLLTKLHHSHSLPPSLLSNRVTT